MTENTNSAPYHKDDLVGRFANSKVLPNLVMILMFLAGGWGLYKLNIQFFPNFGLDFVNINVAWQGAAPEDVEAGIIEPLEEKLLKLEGVKKINATAYQGRASIWMEYEEGSDMDAAKDEVESAVEQVRNLPESSEDPVIRTILRKDDVARVVLKQTDPNADVSASELRSLVEEFETELLSMGISDITIRGLPTEQISVDIPARNLAQLGLSLNSIGQQINSLSKDVPAGTVGGGATQRQLRSSGQQTDVDGFQSLQLRSNTGELIRLQNIAEVRREPANDDSKLFFDGVQAIELTLLRTAEDDALKMAEILEAWRAKTAPTMPAGIELQVYAERWKFIDQRINLLLENGLGGLVLIVLILILFLNVRVAFWVTIGIPTSFALTLLLLYLFGGTINMISLFALIMALGIIVDDAIVVGEDAYAHYQTGENPLQAAEGGARRMLSPVVASSMTTIAAFLPLMMVGGYMGAILFEIPLVIICVILASLVESFIVLPGHLSKSFKKQNHKPPHPRRIKIDRAFDAFRDGPFTKAVSTAIKYRSAVFAAMIVSCTLAVSSCMTGHVKFTFFPQPESSMLIANIAFSAGTSSETIEDYVQDAQRALRRAEKNLGQTVVDASTGMSGQGYVPGTNFTRSGEQFGFINVELTDPDARDIRNPAVIAAWEKELSRPAGLESVEIFARKTGPPGRALAYALTGTDAKTLKQASLELQNILNTYAGVSGVADDLPYGREENLYQLTPRARQAGLTDVNIGQQIRAAFAGQLVQVFTLEGDELEVRVQLPKDEREDFNALAYLPIILPNGASMPLGDAVNLTSKRGFDRLRHENGSLAVVVSADVDSEAGNTREIATDLQKNVLPELVAKYGISYRESGELEEQSGTMMDMIFGAGIGAILIYLILAWVFNSWGWPLIVISVIPIGVVGAVFGHWLLGLDVTLLSIFGMFALAGIVVNDSIILVVFYREQREPSKRFPDGQPIRAALLDAARLRLRAVLLTSLTTIGGLTPLLFETSLQAQFLIPMAATIVFGLATTTIIVLILVPALLSYYEDSHHTFSVSWQQWKARRALKQT